MALRLQPVLKEIIHADQTGFLPGRFIGENLRTIQDVIDFTTSSSSPALLLALDFRKAFDCVRWQFIFRAFEEMGFGDSFVASVKTIFKNIQSSISNSGFTSNYLFPSRGMRQGCCVSPYLFLVAVEILAIQMRQNSGIRGITVGCDEALLSQFADDLTVFVPDVETAQLVLREIDSFGKFSGLIINRDKSHLLQLGPDSKFDVSALGIKLVERTKILGIWFSPHRSINDHYEWNFKDILTKMLTICHCWHNRSLSLKGKIVVFNSLVISLLHYVATNSALPPRVLVELRKMVVHFLWNGGSSKIAYSTLVQPIEAGGPKLADFATRIHASRLLWVRRLLLREDSFSRSFVDHLSGDLGVSSLILGKPKFIPSQFSASPFYTETFNIWLKLHGFPPSSESEVRWEILWNNKRISLEGNPI